jgi:xanthosine phosphorylase
MLSFVMERRPPMPPGFTTATLPAQAAALITDRRPGFVPRAGLVLGSGLGRVAAALADAMEIPYGEVPGFPAPSVSGHAGRLVLGWLGGVPVACLAGRQHFYEGAGFDAMTVAVRSLRLLGCEMLVLTCAAGSLRRSVGAGRLMMVVDHINLMGASPLTGPNDGAFGPRFPGLAGAWDAGLSERLRRTAARQGVALAEGVYAAVPGPSFETPAEVRMLARLGADAVGMSMVPECLVARHCGMSVVGCAVITNLAQEAPVPEGAGDPVDHERTLATAGGAADAVARLVAGFLEEWGHDRVGRESVGAG